MLNQRRFGTWSMGGRRRSGTLIGIGLSRIVNDPNGWFEDPRDLVTAIERIVYVSVESTRIIEGLPREVTGGATE